MKKDIESINKGQKEMKNTIYELKNIIEGITTDTTDKKDCKKLLCRTICQEIGKTRINGQISRKI